MVEGVKHLGAELNAIMLSESPVLIDREVNVFGVWSADAAAPQRAELPDARQRECRGVQELALVSGVQINRNAWYQVRALVTPSA